MHGDAAKEELACLLNDAMKKITHLNTQLQKAKTASQEAQGVSPESRYWSPSEYVSETAANNLGTNLRSGPTVDTKSDEKFRDEPPQKDFISLANSRNMRIAMKRSQRTSERLRSDLEGLQHENARLETRFIQAKKKLEMANKT